MRIAILKEADSSYQDLQALLNISIPIHSIELIESFEILRSRQNMNSHFDLLIWLSNELDQKRQEVLYSLQSSYPLLQIIFISDFVPVYGSELHKNNMYFISSKEIRNYFSKALAMVKSNLNSKNPTVLSLSWKKSRYYVSFTDIQYCERVHRITFIHTADKIFKTTKSLTELREEFPSCFISCHKSYLVNLHEIKQVSYTELELKQGTVIPISRSRTADFGKHYAEFVTSAHFTN